MKTAWAIFDFTVRLFIVVGMVVGAWSGKYLVAILCVLMLILHELQDIEAALRKK